MKSPVITSRLGQDSVHRGPTSTQVTGSERPEGHGMGCGGHPRLGFSAKAVAPEPRDMAGQRGGRWGVPRGLALPQIFAGADRVPGPTGFVRASWEGTGWRSAGV